MGFQKIGLSLICIALIIIPLSVNSNVYSEPPELKIAGQFGLVYAPLMVAEKLKLFEKMV